MKFLRFIYLLVVVASIGFSTGKSFVLTASTISERKDQNMDYEQLKIKSYKHWDLYLHENQCYLGRVFVQLKNQVGVEDFLDIKGEVRDEFFVIGNQVKHA